VALLALACWVLVLVGVGAGVMSDLDGTSALAWLIAAAFLAPALILSALTYEQRGWTRVCPDRFDERLRWVAWRSVLDEAATGGGVDPRVLPYAAATGSIAGIAPRRAGPTDVGLAAATPELIASLRRVAGARD
jgi:hypothetical protein